MRLALLASTEEPGRAGSARSRMRSRWGEELRRGDETGSPPGEEAREEGFDGVPKLGAKLLGDREESSAAMGG